MIGLNFFCILLFKRLGYVMNIMLWDISNIEIQHRLFKILNNNFYLKKENTGSIV